MSRHLSRRDTSRRAPSTCIETLEARRLLSLMVVESSNVRDRDAAEVSPSGDSIVIAQAGSSDRSAPSDQFSGKSDVAGVAADHGTNVVAGLPLATIASRTAPVNHPPVLGAIADQTLDEGSTRIIAAVGSDPDPGQTIRYSLDPNTPSWAAIDPISGKITLAPPDGPASADITARVTDSFSPPAIAIQTFHVTVNNVAPTVTLPGGDATLQPGDTLARSGSFADPGLIDQWRATVDYGDGTGSQPLNLAADKSFALSHPYATTGSYTVTVTVTDKDNAEGTASFRAVVASDAPPATRPGTVSFGQSVYQVSESAGAVLIEVKFTPGSRPTGSVIVASVDSSATAGVDYGATSASIAFAAGQVSRTISVPILDAGITSGTRTFRLSFVGASGTGDVVSGGIASAEVVIRDDDTTVLPPPPPPPPPSPPPSTPPPVILARESPILKSGAISGVTLVFSGPLQDSSATDPSHYQLVTFTKGRKGRTTPHAHSIKTISFDGTATVSLKLASRNSFRGTAQLLISGLADQSGRVIATITAMIHR